MTINIGRGRRALEWALEQDVHIILIQEHRGTKEKVAAYQMLAARHKWNGVWTEALETSDLGRSGGVAILAKDPILAVKGKGKYDHRWVSAILPYTRTRAVHIHCIYGWDRTYEDDGRNAELSQRIQEEISKNGRVPYMVGGDWNQTPEEVAEHWRKIAHPKVSENLQAASGEKWIGLW